MERFDYWRLCDELSVDQAAHLVIGVLPGEVEAMAAGGAELTAQASAEYQANLGGVFAAISNAVLGKRLAGTIRYRRTQSWDSIAKCMVDDGSDEPDWPRSTVLVSDLKSWLWSRGLRSGFFFPEGNGAAEYLNPQHPRYAPKLAAAVRAWLAVEDPNGKHPKQALLKWLREHSADFCLSDDEGKPNEQGIDECAKVANWQPGGGAPKTPSA